MTDYNEIRELLSFLKPPIVDQPISLMQGIVASVENLTCTVALAGSGVYGISGFYWLVDAYTPIVGDTVWVIKNGSDKFILGRTTGGPSRTENTVAAWSGGTTSAGSGVLTSMNLNTTVFPSKCATIYGGLMVPLYSGLYRASATVYWSKASTSGFRRFEFVQSSGVGAGTTYYTYIGAPAPGEDSYLPGSRVIRMKVGDWYAVKTFQNSGVNLNTSVVEASLEYLGP